MKSGGWKINLNCGDMECCRQCGESVVELIRKELKINNLS